MERRVYEGMAELQRDHWWFRARRRIVRTLLLDHVPVGGLVLEIGAGTGGNLRMLNEWGPVTALEPDAFAACHLARHFGVSVVRESVPTDRRDGLEAFDVIVALDVLEHIEEHQRALEFMFERLKPGGTVVLTVPAFQWLWSSHDVTVRHRRRYGKVELVRRVRAAGFEIRLASYFGMALLPPAMVIRWMDGIRPGAGQWGTGRLAPWIDRCLYAIFAAEARLLRFVALPWGLSIVVVGRSAPAE